MYIDKYWNDFIGGTDDSMILLDYIEQTQEMEYALESILKDFNINSSDIEYYRGTPSVCYIDDEGIECDIEYVIDIMQDLSVLVLESYKNGNIKLSDLTEGTDEKVFKITSNKECLELLLKVLMDFSKNPLIYEISEMVDENDMFEIARQCEEIVVELKGYL